MRSGRLNLPRLVLLAVVPLLAIAGAGYWWLSGGRYVVTENAYVKAHIVQIAPEVAGTVRRVCTVFAFEGPVSAQPESPPHATRMP